MLETIFLTGASGLVGNRCLLRALQQGYRVLASARSQARADAIRRSMGNLATDSNLSFVVIPDMTAKGVFDRPVKSADYTIHVASPLWRVDESLPAEELKKAWVDPAVASTMGILEAALQNPSMKKVVLTSSAGAITTLDRSFGDNVDGILYTAYSRVPDSHYETIKPDPIEHYLAAKALCINATDRFMSEKSPHFDVINVVPTSVVGRYEMAETTTELLANSNIRALAIAVGQDIGKTPTGYIHVDDLAKIHVDVLKTKSPKYVGFAAHVGESCKEQAEAVKKHFPEAVKDGRFPMNGKMEDRPFLLDSQETEKFFGWKFQTLEAMVKDLGQHYLELLAKERS